MLSTCVRRRRGDGLFLFQMPRRSNDFQRMIAEIYRQLAPTGARVSESALVRELSSGSYREVDVLIEHVVVDTDVVIAVECRDRRRPSDLVWIDELIGKYAHLPVDRVIAVSRSGFSDAARQKAKASRIELRTLDECTRADWPHELQFAAIGRLDVNVSYLSYEWVMEPPTDPSQRLTEIIIADIPVDLEIFSAVEEANIRDLVNEYLASEIGRAFVYAEQMATSFCQIYCLHSDSTIFVTSDGVHHVVRETWIACEITTSYRNLPNRQYAFGGSTVTQAVVDPTTGETATLVVGPGESLAAAVDRKNRLDRERQDR